MAVHIVATDCIIEQPLISQRDEALTRESIFDEDSPGAYRGLLFAMLFNVCLAVSGFALWLIVRK